MMILFWTEQQKMRISQRACLSGKFMFYHVLVFSEIEDYKKVLHHYFSSKWSFFVICGFFALFGMS